MVTQIQAVPDSPPGGFIDVLASDDLQVGEQRAFWIGGTPVLLCRTEAGLHAMVNKCPHALQPIEGGRLRNGAIRCPRHGAVFSLATGLPLNGVTTKPITLLSARERDQRIEIAIN